MASRARQLGTEGRVRVEGLRELHKKLGKLDKETRGSALGKALLASAKPIEDEWSRLAPRSNTPSGSRGKGHAADHIASMVKTGEGVRISEAHIGPEADFWYLVFSEFGTPHQPASAPGRRAADSKFKEAVREFRDELATQVKRAVR